MRRFVLIVLTALALVAPLSAASAFPAVPGTPAVPARAQKLPSAQQWIADVNKAMQGSRAYLERRLGTRKRGERLAVNLDIDNTSLASHYAPGQRILVVRKFASYARAHGITVLFNTGRDKAGAAKAPGELKRAGFPVGGVCYRKKGEKLAQSKPRCRRQFVAAGFTIVANVGNRETDFVGGNYERGFRLPDYGKQLS